MELGQLVEKLTLNGQRLLKPLTALLLTLYIVSFGIITLFTYQLINKVYKDNIGIEFDKVTRFYTDQIDVQTQLQELILFGLLSNAEVLQSLRQGEGFEKFDDKFVRFSANNVSHLYFISKQQVVLYRAHSPKRKGDLINRSTMRDAVTHRKVTSGLEFGVLGTFTLRTVAPVLEQNTLIGYLEIGMELGHVARKVERQFSVQLVEFFDRKLIEADEFRGIMNIAGRISDTEGDAHYLINHNPDTPISFEFKNQLKKHFDPGQVKTIQLSERRAVMLTPMFDHSLQLAGFTAFIMDTSGLVEERNSSFKNALAALMVLATIAIAIFVYILRYVEMAVRTYSDENNKKTVKLQSTITQLETAQKKVIEQEKFASLGSMVAGVSHEISTPLGISITAVTSLSSEVEKLQDSANKEELTKRQLKGFINDAFEMTELIERNLLRGADLLDSFKKVAVDQSSGNVRTVKFCEFLHEVVSSMGPNLSKSTHHVTIDCDPELTVKTVPGYWSQIIINLISNSLKHGFEGMEHGVILIQVKQSKTDIQLLFSDNGRGIDSESSAKVFEPFYTTKRDSGGSGLGLHLVYNLVSQGLNGAITLKESTQGCVFDIKVPI